MSVYENIAQRTGQHPVRRLWRGVGAAASAYHAWHNQRVAPPPVPAVKRVAIEVFTHYVRRYDTRWLRAGLGAHGHVNG